MKIVIIGGGMVGFTIASQLTNEGHDITVVDRNPAVADQISDSLDCMALAGNGASLEVMRSADVPGSDLLIACTAQDELNMLCCIFAKKLGCRSTIARVRTPEYADQMYFFQEELGLSMTINPELNAAREMFKLLEIPGVLKRDSFAKGRVEIVEIVPKPGDMLDGTKLLDLPKKLKSRVLVAAVQRGGEAIIPSGGFRLEAGDELYMTGAPKEVEKAFRKMGMLKKPIENVLITGGGKATYYLAQALSDQFHVKIIERSHDRAQELAETLPNAVVLLGDAADHELLNEEGLRDADAFVAMTGIDEGNILSAMYAKQLGVDKVICKVNTDHLKSLSRSIGIDSIVSSKNVTANTIVRVVRAYAAGEGEGNVRALYRIAEDKAEMLEFAASADMTGIIGVPLKDLKLKPNILIGCIVRKNRAIIPGGADVIEPNDRVLVCTAGRRLTELTDILGA